MGRSNDAVVVNQPRWVSIVGLSTRPDLSTVPSRDPSGLARSLRTAVHAYHFYNRHLPLPVRPVPRSAPETFLKTYAHSQPRAISSHQQTSQTIYRARTTDCRTGPPPRYRMPFGRPAAAAERSSPGARTGHVHPQGVCVARRLKPHGEYASRIKAAVRSFVHFPGAQWRRLFPAPLIQASGTTGRRPG